MKKKNKARKRISRAAPTRPAQAVSDQYLDRGQDLLAQFQHLPPDSSPEVLAQRKQQLDAALTTLLQGIALGDMEQAQADHQRGKLSDQQKQRRIDTALDEFNQAVIPTPPEPEESRSFIWGANGEFIYLG
ncbi:hypothetical protein IC229_24340 [Spirosoma sp. BT702]|uniref:Uncharacterized protein n=1 Tax=Spirosoma profusum TaxID=2771354 RepID=A0A927ASF9_9BACT|nr:hypothetical protein [Spirosoma profusum]MBD2703798.1 hypothetical protein [Spirosoma profusum]